MKFDTLLKPEVACRYANDGYWTGDTITTYFEKAERLTPDKLAIVAPGVRMTYAELGADVRLVEARLAALDVGKGDVVSIQLPNCAEFVIVHLAASRLGAVTNPLLPNYRASELLHILGVAGSVVAVIPQEYRQVRLSVDVWGNAKVVAGLAEHLRRRWRRPRGNEALRHAAPKRWPCVFRASRASARDPDEITSLIFTSGTESKPKGVMHSHNTQMYGTVHMAKVLGLTADDVVWTPSPVGHGTGFQWGVRQAITLGSTLVLQDLWNADDALRLIARERCTFTLAATPFAAMLLDSALIDALDLSSFRIFACAGAAIPHKLGVDMRERVGCKLIGMWGMTECFVGSSSAPSDPEAKLWGTDGQSDAGL
jgi:acyl-CoA synthetase (AMP-forming)/AMP-acid ligase II